MFSNLVQSEAIYFIFRGYGQWRQHQSLSFTIIMTYNMYIYLDGGA